MDKQSYSPDISIIIAAYNVSGYIRRAINSALNQHEVQVEIIVVDDASTDNTLAVASSIKDYRIRIISCTQNGGPSAARNRGIAIASGKWISILDADDAFAPQRLIRCLELAKFHNADIVIDNLEVWHEADHNKFHMYQLKDFKNKSVLDLPTFIRGNSSFMGGISLGYVKPIFLAEFLKRHNLSYNSNIKIGEDYMMMAEALACGAKCVIEKTAGYFYTVRTGSISHRLSLDDIARIRRGDKEFFSNYNFNEAEIRAQKYRDNKLNHSYFFIKLVFALKEKRSLDALKTIITHPISCLYLYYPLWAIIKRGLQKL